MAVSLGLFILALVAGLVTSLFFLGEFQSKAREFDQLAVWTRYDRAVASERTLYPAWPCNVQTMETWLHDECEPLMAMRTQISATVESLRQKALPASEQDRETDPDYRESQWLESLRRAQAIRTGARPLVVPELTAEQQALTVDALSTLAWERVAPQLDQRKVFGEEALGIAFARAAAAKTSSGAGAWPVQHTLAWALLATGQDEAALEQLRRAMATVPSPHERWIKHHLTEFTRAVEQAPATLLQAEKEHAQRAAESSAGRTLRFASQDAALQFLHDTLVELLGKLDSLAATQRVAVEQRLAWARQLRDGLARHHPRARVSWNEVSDSIRSSGSRNKYAGREIELRDEDVAGLVPIGVNPKTHLWEFYHLRSAWDGVQDPAEIEIPEHRSDGSIEVTGDTGIVFVLLPGGMVTLGSQGEDPEAPYYDPQRYGDETLHEVLLIPFFMARHELTQAQWARLKNPDENMPPAYDRLNESAMIISWPDVRRAPASTRAMLPTEAQWEYACRAGSTTP